MIEGMTFHDQRRGVYASNEAHTCIGVMPNYGIEWVSIIVVWYQDNVNSTSIYFKQPEAGDWRSTETDENVASIINHVHDLGMKVMLKPHVDLDNDPDHWRGQIGSGFSETEWQSWFGSYSEFINHYALLAQENNVEMFSVGTELADTTNREMEWREVIAGVRQRFSGQITYAAHKDYEADRILWWDVVDYIGVDAWNSLTNKNTPTINELESGWQGPFNILRALYDRWGKQVIFTEIGYLSVDGTNKIPALWNLEGDIDYQEQADCYQAAFEVFWNEPWFAGIFWWHTEIGGDCEVVGTGNRHFTPLGKPAGEVLRNWYEGPSN
jgi:hypothetical protein